MDHWSWKTLGLKLPTLYHNFLLLHGSFGILFNIFNDFEVPFQIISQICAVNICVNFK